VGWVPPEVVTAYAGAAVSFLAARGRLRYRPATKPSHTTRHQADLGLPMIVGVRRGWSVLGPLSRGLGTTRASSTWRGLHGAKLSATAISDPLFHCGTEDPLPEWANVSGQAERGGLPDGDTIGEPRAPSRRARGGLSGRSATPRCRPLDPAGTACSNGVSISGRPVRLCGGTRRPCAPGASPWPTSTDERSNERSR
jgi:hypothetical protein